METFQVGDKVYHNALPSVHWIIESIDGDKAVCSTVIKETLEQKKETFLLSSIKRYETPLPRISTSRRRNNYW